jgi:hypothetical protein
MAGSEFTEAQSFVESLLLDPQVSAPPSVAIDIGFIQGKGWAVIEANPSWGAGIYGCEPREALYTVARGCRTFLTDEDKKWVIERIEAQRREIARDAQESLAAFCSGQLEPQSAQAVITELRQSLEDQE